MFPADTTALYKVCVHMTMLYTPLATSLLPVAAVVTASGSLVIMSGNALQLVLPSPILILVTSVEELADPTTGSPKAGCKLETSVLEPL